ncbi:MAG: LuxR C-terminal-related transcriptional regulator [Actinomycetota bacterium]
MTTQLPPGNTPPHRSVSRRPLAVRLDREWQALCDRPAVMRRARAWGIASEFHSLDELVAATGRRPSAGCIAAEPADPVDQVAANALVARLLLIARTDDLAARVVLQRLLPGLLAAARRWQRRNGSATDAFDELVAAAWAVIREFPVERRPQHLVSNLLRDSEYHAFVRARRRLLVHEPVATDRLDGPEHPAPVEPLGELIEVVACTPSLSAHDRRLLSLLLSGRTTLEVAAALQISERTVRAHRDSMVGRMRQAMAA